MVLIYSLKFNRWTTSAIEDFDIIILSDDTYAHPEDPTEYQRSILYDDGLVHHGLEKMGYKVARKSWADPSFDWTMTRYALFRSTWDYFYRFEEFRSWLTQVSGATQLINPHSLIEWNLDKHYLKDLSLRQVNVVPTHYAYGQDTSTLADIAKLHHWQDVVMKPTISGTAMDTHYITSTRLAQEEMLFRSLCAKQTMMVQPFQQFIVDQGELSLIVIGGQFTHSVKKMAKSGDFRVQSDFGGTVAPYEPSPEEVAFAEHVVSQCPDSPHYARVDIIYDNEGKLSLVELELIEPELWFRRNPPAAQQLAEGIAATCP
ncbi:MAG: hypothetical protein AAGA85_05855 [Bacteroidota bacterium]